MLSNAWLRPRRYANFIARSIASSTSSSSSSGPGNVGFPLSPPPRSTWERGMGGVRKQLSALKEHLREKVVGPDGVPLGTYMAQQSHVPWACRGPHCLEDWLVSSDAEMGGRSRSFLSLSKNNKTLLFHGELNNYIPRDGKTKYSGYCTLRSKPRLGFMNKKKAFDWGDMNVLFLRVRGDGRPYMINISVDNYYTHMQNDLYHYFLFTRGGPTWQDVKIPFSKFFLASRGRINDVQHPIQTDRVGTLGFTLGEQADGPFQLEIDFIGVYKDPAHSEEFAYETYKRNPNAKR
ncbi:complex I intermediate-associated protein 30, mitochondrial [Lampetra fluviatilis]